MKKKQTYKDLLKTTLSGIISIGVGSIIGDIAGYFLPKNMKLMARAGSSLATFILTNTVTGTLSTVVEAEIDNVITTE